MGMDCNHPDTNLAAGHCIPDADDGATTTNPLDADTDDGGVSDGDEDLNKNGMIDGNETDPHVGADDNPGGEGGGGTGGSSSGTGGSSSGTGGSSSGTGGSSSGTGGNAIDGGQLFAQGGCACAMPGGRSVIYRLALQSAVASCPGAGGNPRHACERSS